MIGTINTAINVSALFVNGYREYMKMSKHFTTMAAKLGSEEAAKQWYKENGAKGGRNNGGKNGFYGRPDLARKAGRIGGLSRGVKWKSGKCQQGHAMTKDNIRIVGIKTVQRVCDKCYQRRIEQSSAKARAKRAEYKRIREELVTV